MSNQEAEKRVQEHKAILKNMEDELKKMKDQGKYETSEYKKLNKKMISFYKKTRDFRNKLHFNDSYLG